MSCFCSAAAGQWKAAQEVFEQMLPCGCKPDGMTYGILISAYDKGNQWCLALQVSLPDPSQCTVKAGSLCYIHYP